MPAVADHAAQQAVVRPAHEQALVVAHLAERLDVELELLLVRGALGHLAVQAVQGVDQQDLVRRQLHVVDVELPLAGLEVVVRRLDRLAFQQRGDVLVDQLQVQGVRRLVVVVAEFVLGMLLEVEEVVVDVQRQELLARLGQLLADLDRGGGLARRAGPGDEEHPRFREALDELLGAGADFHVVALFAGGDQFGELAGGDEFVEAFHGFAAVVHVPAQHLVDLLVRDVVGGFELVGPLGARHLPLVAVEDVGPRRLGVAFLDQDFLDDVLGFLDRRNAAGAVGPLQLLLDQRGQPVGFGAVAAAHGRRRLEDGRADAVPVVGHRGAVAFHDLLDDAHASSCCGSGWFLNRSRGSLPASGCAWDGASCAAPSPRSGGCARA